MKRLLEQIVRMIVDHPDEIRLTSLQGATTTIYELRCNGGDIGKIIGKDGKTVSAMRTLLSVMAVRRGRRAVLEIVE